VVELRGTYVFESRGGSADRIEDHRRTEFTPSGCQRLENGTLRQVQMVGGREIGLFIPDEGWPKANSITAVCY
jgi:hypothetical protein